MSSRVPEPLSSGAHRRACAKRDRRTVVALRRAAAIERKQVDALRLAMSRRDIPAAKIASKAIEGELRGKPYADHVLVDRLESLLDRAELRAEAARLGIRPDDLGEIRLRAREIATALFGGKDAAH